MNSHINIVKENYGLN